VRAFTIRQEVDDTMRHVRDAHARRLSDRDLRLLDDAAIALADGEERRRSVVRSVR